MAVEEAEAEKAVAEGAVSEEELEGSRTFLNAANFDSLDTSRPNPSELHKQKIGELSRHIEAQV